MSDIVVDNLTGGMIDTDPPSSLQPNQVVYANNVEWFQSRIGERRGGCTPYPITGSTFDSYQGMVHLSQWFPANNQLSPEYWGVSATPGVSNVIARQINPAGIWTPVTPVDGILSDVPSIYQIKSQTGPASVSPGGKLFWAYHSNQDRLHVWDPNNGPTLRRTGLAAPANAPTAVDEGVGNFSGTRYYRVRFVRQAGTGSQVSVRSEPSPVLTFTPSGAGHGATVTRPTAPGESETHWELEASLDNANFYVIQSLLVATTTFNDEAVFGGGYAGGTNALSDAIGSYLLQPSAKYIIVVDDRMVSGGHWTNLTLQSNVWWSPVATDPGVGNDERNPIVTTGGTPIVSVVALDNYVNGGITGLATAVSGSFYAFKWKGIYKFNRTGDVTKAYDVLTISTLRGAIPDSVVVGVDQYGSPCIYYLDPLLGPSMINSGGPQQIYGIRNTWNRVNLNAASIVSKAVFYPYKNQIHWWIAVDGSDAPTIQIVVQINLFTAITNGVSGGISLADGRISQAQCVSMMTGITNINGATSFGDRPFIGLTGPDYIQRCDVESTDALQAYVALIRTRPYILTGLLNDWGAMTGALLAIANSGANIVIRLVRDFGLESQQTLTTNLAPTLTESEVQIIFDNLSLSDAKSIQIEFGDQ